MADEKTFVVRRVKWGMLADHGQFAAHGSVVSIWAPALEWPCDTLEVTIRPQKSKRERKLEIINTLLGSVRGLGHNPDSAQKLLDALEAIDAEDP